MDMRKRTKKILLILGIVLAMLLLLCAAAFYRGLVSRRYVVTSEKLHNDTPIRIAVLADLHNYTYGGDQQPIIRRVEKMRPDLICLVGDIPDDINPIQGTELLLAGLVDIAPCLSVVGNHEYWGNYEAMFEVFDRYEVPILRNEALRMTLKGQEFTIYGIDDPWYSRPWEYEQFLENWVEPEDDSYTILLSHRPDPIEMFATRGFDLVLSGHTHGGQVRIPFFINGLFAPDQGWYPKYAGGLYRVEETTLVISRGLSYYPELPRIFNPPEVVEVVLKGESR